MCIDLSITIASYNTSKTTCETLESIYSRTSGIEFEVIVVDNASLDDSVKMIRSRFPFVQLIQNNSNVGFAAAHNLALSRAKGKYLLVLNSDMLFLDNAAKRMVDNLDVCDRSIAALGPQILNPDRTLAPSSRRRAFYSRSMVGLSAINQFFPFGHLLPKALMRKYGRELFGWIHDNFNPPVALKEVEWLDGMCVMFKREALEQTGLFDEQFYFDYEIGDLLIRIQSHGWKIFIDPTIKVIHLGGFSRKKEPRLIIRNQQSCLIYYAKHRPKYVSFLRRILLAVIKMKQCLLFARLILSSRRDSLRVRIQVLEEIKQVIVNFRSASAMKNTRVPPLPPI